MMASSFASFVSQKHCFTSRSTVCHRIGLSASKLHLEISYYYNCLQVTEAKSPGEIAAVQGGHYSIIPNSSLVAYLAYLASGADTF